jgi:hypothetical protein
MDEDQELIAAMRLHLEESALGKRPMVDTLSLARELAGRFPHRSAAVIRAMIKTECGVLSIPTADT